MGSRYPARVEAMARPNGAGSCAAPREVFCTLAATDGLDMRAKPEPAIAQRPSPQAAQRFSAAREAYEAGRSLDAYRLLNPLLEAEPRFAAAHHLAGLCLIDLGDFQAAEQALK